MHARVRMETIYETDEDLDINYLISKLKKTISIPRLKPIPKRAGMDTIFKIDEEFCIKPFVKQSSKTNWECFSVSNYLLPQQKPKVPRLLIPIRNLR